MMRTRKPHFDLRECRGPGWTLDRSNQSDLRRPLQNKGWSNRSNWSTPLVVSQNIYRYMRTNHPSQIPTNQDGPDRVARLDQPLFSAGFSLLRPWTTAWTRLDHLKGKMARA